MCFSTKHLLPAHCNMLHISRSYEWRKRLWLNFWRIPFVFLIKALFNTGKFSFCTRSFFFCGCVFGSCMYSSKLWCTDFSFCCKLVEKEKNPSIPTWGACLDSCAQRRKLPAEHSLCSKTFLFYKLVPMWALHFFDEVSPPLPAVTS